MDSLADSRAKVECILRDPEWLAARAKTEEQGPLLHHLENYMLCATAYSKIK